VAFRTESRRIGVAFATLGVGWTILSLAVIRSYSGGVSPFDVRYDATLGAGIGPSLTALARPTVLEYLVALLLSGGWLGVFAPLSLLPALPSLALNTFSSSPWMAAGKAHYSGLVLPFIVLGAAVGLGALRGRRGLQHAASGALVLSSCAGYVLAGAGPFGGNF